MADIDIERFAPTPDPELICPICHSVLHQPYETPCQHVFCKECIITWIRRGRGAFADRGNKCPSCRDYVYHDELKPALTILCNLINKLKVKCINQGAGCTEIISKEYLEGHEKNCEYQEVTCKNAGCPVKSLRRDHQKHAESCTLRLVQCTKECQLRMPHYRLRNHSCLTELRQELKERYLEVAVMREIIETRVPVVSTSLRSEINWVSGDISFNRAMMMSNYKEESQTLRNSERQMLDKLVSGVDPRTLPVAPQNNNRDHSDSDRSPATTDEPNRSPAYSIQSPSNHGGSPVYVPGPDDESPESPPYQPQYDYQFNYDDNENYLSDDHSSSNVSGFGDTDTHNNSDVDIMSEDEADNDNSDSGADDNHSHATSDDDDDDNNNDDDNDENGDHDEDHHSDDAGSDCDNSNADDSDNGNNYGDGGDDCDEQDDNDRYSDNYSPDEHSDYEGGNYDSSDQRPPSCTDSSDDGSDGSERGRRGKRNSRLLVESDTDPLESDNEDTSFEGNTHDDSFQVSSTSSEGSIRSPFSTRREPNVEDDESMNEQLQRPTGDENSPHHSSDDDDDNDDDDDDENIDGDDKNQSENSDSASSDTSASDGTGRTSDNDEEPCHVKEELDDKIHIEVSSDDEGEGNTASDKYNKKLKSGSSKKKHKFKPDAEESSECQSESSDSVIDVSDDDDDYDDDDKPAQRKHHNGKESHCSRTQGKKTNSGPSEDTLLSRKQAEEVVDVNETCSEDDADSDVASSNSDEDAKPSNLKLKRQLSNSSDYSDDYQAQGHAVYVKDEPVHIASFKDSPSSPEASDDDDDDDDDDDEPERSKTSININVLSENGLSHSKRRRESSSETSHFSEGSFEPDYTDTDSGEEVRISKKHELKVSRTKSSSPKLSTTPENGTCKTAKRDTTPEQNRNTGLVCREVPKKCSVGGCTIPDCVPQDNMSQQLVKDISMLIKKTSGSKRTLASPPLRGDSKKRKLVTVNAPIKAPQC